MKTVIAGTAIVTLCLIATARAEEEPARPAAAKVPAQAEPADWWQWSAPASTAPAAAAPRPAAVAADEEVDVVDAHWMALTMWGEARSGGEEAMRAVGHVIDNRRRLGRHGRYVTETVSEAWQFSCWNAGDPNRAAMLNVDALPEDGEDARRWRIARRLADDILAGRSADPTGGALFYHTGAVSPRWSEGIAPIAEIGGHLFFRTAL